MKRIAAAAPIIALVTALSATPVLGQTKDVKPPAAAPAPAPAVGAEKPAAAKSEAKPVAHKPSRSRATMDARHCLQLATNMAIHQCAEKYR
jgi:hypothetical protein